jgi:hypothetical protein
MRRRNRVFFLHAWQRHKAGCSTLVNHHSKEQALMMNDPRCWIRWKVPCRWLAATTLALLLAAGWAAPPAQANKLETASVMAPLDMRFNDQMRNDFRRQLKIAKDMGVKSVEVDVWWGVVAQNGEDQLDWSYYDSVFGDIEQAGLHIVPIMSFHKCGGNVGDSCNIPLPYWMSYSFISDKSNGQKCQCDLMYKSEQGNLNNETVALWEDDWAIPKYQAFMAKFKEHYAGKNGIIDEIVISTGPAGELRYPSYNSHDTGSGWPTRGFFQAYSEPARADFRAWVIKKYGNLDGVNKAWGRLDTPLTSVEQIGPPEEGQGGAGRANKFVERGDYQRIAYGRDFIDWYNGSLIKHGRRMLDAANKSFGGDFAVIPLAIKIPGVHWQMASDTEHPRIAEIAAGLIPTSVDFSSDDSGHGYGPAMAMIKDFRSIRSVNLHFTALERDNCEETHTCWQDASQAKALVFWMAQAANANQVPIKGENALSGGVTYDHGWDNIVNAFQYSSYSGLTVLRIADVTDNPTGKWRYSNFIAVYRNWQ